MFRDDIVIYGEDVLRQKADEITDFNDEIKELINHMYEVMVENRGLGLAGPQIGISKRIFVYDIGEGPHAMINPKIVKRSGKECGIEGCLSIPGLQGEVTRADRVTVKGLDENGEEIVIKAEGLLARVFQHEMDHLDGKLFIDRADPDTLETVSQNDCDNGDEDIVD
ncbi:MAG: peptide deformylase [Armatimonadota bacterium]